METKALVKKNMDDVVFENRNQEYGAYSIRKSYPGNVNTAFLSCLLFATAVLALSRVSTLFSEAVIPEIPSLDPVKDWVQPPNVIPIKKPNTSSQPRRTTASFFPIATTSTEPQPIDKPITPVEPDAGVENGTDTGVDVDFQTDGNSTLGTDVVFTDPPIVHDIVQIMPHYKGGDLAMMQFIQRKAKYPARARRVGTEGTVFVRFIVRPDSTITNVEVFRGVSGECDQEALRVVASMKDWIPGVQNKIPVSVRMVVPIKFKLDIN